VTIACPSCQSVEISAHAWVKHLGLNVLKCETCGAQFTSDRKLIERQQPGSADDPAQRSLFER
jgi:transcription elongation factor Elf1